MTYLYITARSPGFAFGLAASTLAVNRGRILRVNDVATVRIGSLTRYGAVTKDGNGETVEGLVLSLRGANANVVVKAVRAKLDELKAAMPKGLTFNVFYDRADLIQRAVGTVSKALAEATVLVLALLLLFLGNLRAALVVAVTLPMAALITFLLMQLFGMTANLMSLGGLAIAIGLIVDAAVVVVENTEERLSRPGQDRVPFLHCLWRRASRSSALCFCRSSPFRAWKASFFRPLQSPS